MAEQAVQLEHSVKGNLSNLELIFKYLDRHTDYGPHPTCYWLLPQGLELVLAILSKSLY
jgi:hypothetical protein